MPRRRRREFGLLEWLIVILIASVLFAVTAPSRRHPRRQARRAISARPAAVPQPAMLVQVPDAAKRVASPPSVLRLWRRVQNPLALALGLHVISRALRRDRRRRPESPSPSHDAPVP